MVVSMFRIGGSGGDLGGGRIYGQEFSLGN